MAEAKRTFYLIDADGKYTVGHVGIDGGVAGEDEGPDVTKEGAPIVTSDPGWIAQLMTNVNITETPPKGKT